MRPNRIESATTQPTMPTVLVSWLAVSRPCFTAPVWNHILVLVSGAVLAPGKRTVTQTLRVMGLADQPGFGRYHEVLNRARWDGRDVARPLLLHLLATLSPSGEVVIGIDDTIERRWGSKIKARGIYRDTVRSSHGHFVKISGLRWLSLAVMFRGPVRRSAIGLTPHRTSWWCNNRVRRLSAACWRTTFSPTRCVRFRTVPAFCAPLIGSNSDGSVANLACAGRNGFERREQQGHVRLQGASL